MKIKLKIIDQNKNAIPFATVALKDAINRPTGTGVAANELGIAEIDVPKSGDYSLEFSAVGHQSTRIKLNVVLASIAMNMPFVMLPVKSSEMNVFTITAKRHKKQNSDFIVLLLVLAAILLYYSFA